LMKMNLRELDMITSVARLKVRLRASKPDFRST
jgi:hypothetical protein